MDVETKIRELSRSASRIVIGGFPPPESLQASWFGRVLLARPGEEWPQHQGKPMLALCQLNLTEAPFVPQNLADIRLITVFISAGELPDDTENGDGWELRAYPTLEGLAPIETPPLENRIKSFPIRWELIEKDYPCYEDVPFDLPDEMWDDYSDLFENCDASKIGGWPSLVQSEIYWTMYGKHPADPEYAFQITSERRLNWQWGDSGNGYFGRGKKKKDVWALNWQCY